MKRNGFKSWLFVGGLCLVAACGSSSSKGERTDAAEEADAGGGSGGGGTAGGAGMTGGGGRGGGTTGSDGSAGSGGAAGSAPDASTKDAASPDAGMDVARDSGPVSDASIDTPVASPDGEGPDLPVDVSMTTSDMAMAESDMAPDQAVAVDAAPDLSPDLSRDSTPPVDMAPLPMVQGLRAYFYQPRSDFDRDDLLKLLRIDPRVDFDWSSKSPNIDVLMQEDYEVRWAGKIKPLYSETYTFHTHSDDGVRLFVGGVKVIDNWTDHGDTEDTGKIALRAGVAYDFRLEFYQSGGGAIVRAEWESASQMREVIPQSAFTAEGLPQADGGTVQVTDGGRSPELSQGAVAYWPFDEAMGTSVADLSGNGNTGTASTGVTWGAGRVGNAVSLMNAQKIMVADSPSLDTIGTQMSISAWVNQTNSTGWQAIISRQHGTTNDAALGLWITSGSTLVFASGTDMLQVVYDFPAAQWVHVALVQDGTGTHIYINGAQVLNVKTTFAIPAETTPFVLGGSITAAAPMGTDTFQGKLDEVIIYNRGLRPSEIEFLANGIVPAPGGAADGGVLDASAGN